MADGPREVPVASKAVGRFVAEVAWHPSSGRSQWIAQRKAALALCHVHLSLGMRHGISACATASSSVGGVEVV